MTTTDPFTTAARAEAEALFLHSAEVPSPQDIGEHIAEWARSYLAAQETDAEVAPNPRPQVTLHYDPPRVQTVPVRVPCPRCGLR